MAWPVDWNGQGAKDRANLELERFGYVLLPKKFYLVIYPPQTVDLQLDQSADEFCAYTMLFEVVNGDLSLRTLQGANMDLSKGIDHLVSQFGPSNWKPLAVSEITQFLAFGGERRAGPAAVSVQFKVGHGEVAVPAKQDSPKGSVEMQKRHRITPEHLSLVAQIYSEARKEGLPPTQAVQKRFDVSHSTAAKWVSAARRSDFLPPAGTESVPGLLGPNDGGELRD
jgi:hypothetical protein